MRTSLARWGNSLALRIPRAIAAEMGVGEGSNLEIEVVGGRLVLCPIDGEPTLESLLEGVTSQNKHEEMDWGAPQGCERW